MAYIWKKYNENLFQSTVVLPRLCLTQVDRWRHSVSDVVQYVTTEKVTRIYCNKFAGSISQWKFITLKVQYTTLDYSPQFF
jgi:hypothetical protein